MKSNRNRPGGKNKILKFEQERECLKECLEFDNIKGNFTREALYALSGHFKDRPDAEDRPDIVVLSPKDSIFHDQYVGVEHFSVHQDSMEMNGKMSSLGKRYREKCEYLYSDGHEEIVKTGLLSDETIQRLFLVAQEGAELRLNYGYKSLLESFTFSLKKHLSNINEYRSNLQRYFGADCANLVFFIELFFNLPPMFINNGPLMYPYNGPGIIYTPCLIDLLSKIPAKDVDIVVLCSRNSFTNEIMDVVAIKTGDIRGSLQAEGVICCPYCGEDVIQDRFFSSSVLAQAKRIDPSEETRYELTLQFNVDSGKAPENAFFRALSSACDFYQRGEMFAASWGVQRSLFALEKYLSKYPLEKLLEDKIPTYVIKNIDARLYLFNALFKESQNKAPLFFRDSIGNG